MRMPYTLGLTRWNLNSFEFKFDDTRLSSYFKDKIGPIDFFFLHPDIALSLACWLSQQNLDSQQDRDRATSGCNKKSYSYIMRKVWYHQSWIQNYWGFIVLILIYILNYISVSLVKELLHWRNIYLFIFQCIP